MGERDPSEPVLRELSKRLRTMSQADVAYSAGCSTQFVNDVIRGRREPTGNLLDWLGFERTVTYRRKRES